MLRKQPNPFGLSEQHLLDALADYASISLVNARLFRTVEGRARSLQQVADTAQVGEKVKNEILRAVKNELNRPVSTALTALLQLSKDPALRLRPDQRQQLAIAQDTLLDIQQIAEAITPFQLLKSARAAGGQFYRSGYPIDTPYAACRAPRWHHLCHPGSQ